MFVITGGSSGIGKALAKNLASRKQSVLILGRNQKELTQIASSSPHIHMLQANLTSLEGRRAVTRYLHNKTHLQGLIHCAGIIEPVLPLHILDEAGWRAILEINLTVPFLLTQCLHKKLIDGRVIYISSHLAYTPSRALSPYCISKLALSSLTRCWQLEYPKIASTSVLPGMVDTLMQTRVSDSGLRTR